MLKKAKIISVAIALLISSLVPTANAEQPTFVGNLRQLEAGMHPVVITPAHSGELISNSKGGALAKGTANTSPIVYTYNNAVLNNPKVVLVWYGTWKSTPVAPANAPVAKDYSNFVNQFVIDYAANARWKMNNSYYSAPNANETSRSYINNLSSTIGNVYIAKNDAKYGKTLGQSSILKIATDGQTKHGALDQNSIYLVLTSSDVAVSGFNAGRVQFCGWHSAATNGMKYGFVGDSANATYCQGQSVSLNGNIGADSMISVLAHEIEEAATDPYVLSTLVWRDSSGMENSDKCAWTWGAYTSTPSGAVYNMSGSSLKYLIQQGFKLGTVTPGAGKDSWSGSCEIG